MSSNNNIDKDFLARLTEIIHEHIDNEMFGVSELAVEIGMSRSNLLRKVQKAANVSASQFIRQVRLQKAMVMIRQSSLTVSEISYQVGFSSTSYFIKCFREEYGYSPGEAGKRSDEDLRREGQSTQKHQLAAIMFTDIEGFTALMQQNEEQAMQFRNRHRDDFEKLTHKFDGKILQYFGDGTLSTFNSAIDAVRCGIELQLAFSKDPQIPVRIGIHTGDILFSDDGIAGDGVNVASRIESLAKTQSVFISEKVFDEVKNQAGIQCISMGVFELKNVDKPMEVYAIANPGLVVPDKKQITGKVKVKSEKVINSQDSSKKTSVLWFLLPIIAVLVGYILYSSDLFQNLNRSNTASAQIKGKKSIAILPFKNDSNDSSNVYFVNGLMESTLNNLQKIKDLRVVSRTSVEKYRNTTKTSPEIGRELNVHFLIEGSGQKIGDQIMLHIQLINAGTDEHLWSEQYNREAKDIFALQMEVAKIITDQIEVIITPDEAERINTPPTDNVLAYDYFLQGLDLLYYKTYETLHKSIELFQKAIDEDNEFARAYAAISIAYYYLDEGLADKQYGDTINHYADKALLFDDQLPQSLIAKGLFYMHSKQYTLAADYFEKALEYNPNEDVVYVFLIELYSNYLPDTEKYLEYALRATEIDIAAYDSMVASVAYIHISSAFSQNGFIEEAEKYINKSLDYVPDNSYSEYLKAFILFAKDRDLQQLRQRLTGYLQQDTTRFDIMQDVAKICYYQRDYDKAYYYYKKFVQIRKALNLDVYRGEDAKIGLVYSKMGFEKEAEEFFTRYKEYADKDQTVYKHLSLAAYHAYRNEKDEAITQLKAFSEEDNYFYWIILFLDIDPLMENISDHPEFKPTLKKIESRFWDYHKEMKDKLEGKGII